MYSRGESIDLLTHAVNLDALAANVATQHVTCFTGHLACKTGHGGPKKCLFTSLAVMLPLLLMQTLMLIPIDGNNLLPLKNGLTLAQCVNACS